MAVLLANTRSALALTATSVCKKILPQCPARSEISWAESTGSLASRGCKRVESMVRMGLVTPMVNTTSKSAIPATFLRGVFMTGESCEMLSKPEKARNEPAKPIRMETPVSFSCANILGKSDRKEEKDIWVKTVTRMATSLAKAITAPTRLTLALSLTPTQFRMPSSTSTPMVISTANGPIAGRTTLR